MPLPWRFVILLLFFSIRILSSDRSPFGFVFWGDVCLFSSKIEKHSNIATDENTNVLYRLFVVRLKENDISFAGIYIIKFCFSLNIIHRDVTKKAANDRWKKKVSNGRKSQDKAKTRALKNLTVGDRERHTRIS